MSELPISAGEAQGIFNAIWPAIKERFFLGFYTTIKANGDHVEIALEKLERDTNGVMDEILQDILTNGNELPQGSERLLRSIATVDGFESQSETVMNTPIIGQLLELHVVQDKEFQKILTRAEHAMESFMKLYRKESLKYAESKIPNIKLLNKEREKLVKMAELCMRDMQIFLNKKILDLLQWLIVQSIRHPGAQNIDIESLQAQFVTLEQKDYYVRIAVCLDGFLKEMIDLITIE